MASHPKKELSCKSQESPSVDRETPSLQLAPLEPLTSAWDNQTFISNRGVENSVFVAALHTKLPQILWDTSRGPSAAFHINYPPYMPLEVQTLFGERDFHVQAHCLAHIPEVGEYDGSDESYCVFFFDVRIATMYTPRAPNLHLVSIFYHTHMGILGQTR